MCRHWNVSDDYANLAYLAVLTSRVASLKSRGVWLEFTNVLCMVTKFFDRFAFSRFPRREVPEPAVRRLQTRRKPLWNAWDCFITENLVLPVMYDSVHSVLVKQHGYIQWTNCTKNTLLGN